MAARTGKQFLAELKRGRNIWLGHEKVEDVGEHPAFKGAAGTVAELFDLQHKYPEDCLIPDPENGEPINAAHMIPRSKEDVKHRHKVFERFAELSVGQVGRSPDNMSATYAGFAGKAKAEWSGHGNEEGAHNLVEYQKYIRRQDVLITQAIVGPTVDRATDGRFPDNAYDLRKVGETEHGIIVRGAKILATLAPFADEVSVYPGPPLPEGADDFALAFAIPMDTPGLKFLCRDSVSKPDERFDHPFSSRFDEQDAFIIFDDVEVPRNRVHINGNVAAYNTVVKGTRRANMMQQAMIRAQTKLEFAWGLATCMVETINGMQPPTPQMLGEIWTYAEFARACIAAAEEAAYDYGDNVWFPQSSPMFALTAAVPVWMPRVNEIIRLLGSHNMFATPTRRQLDSELAPLIERYLPGASISAEKRARIFRLAWDFSGTALAARNEQYERFYLTSSARNYQTAQMIADRKRARRLVDQFL